jgi:hypothetical protein
MSIPRTMSHIAPEGAGGPEVLMSVRRRIG